MSEMTHDATGQIKDCRERKGVVMKGIKREWGSELTTEIVILNQIERMLEKGTVGKVKMGERGKERTYFDQKSSYFSVLENSGPILSGE